MEEKPLIEIMPWQILQRVITAVNKLFFCFTVASTTTSFLKLILNTKRFRWSKKSTLDENESREKPVFYSLTLKKGVSRNVFLRTYSGDLQIFYDVFWHNIYRLPIKHFTNARTIVDIGAHIGMASLFFRLNAPNARIYALEADVENYQVLLKNLDIEIKRSDVIPIHVALTDRNTEIYLQRSRLSYNTSISQAATKLKVRGIAMKQFLQETRITTIDILKIDIEGAEDLLFSADTAWLNNVENILIEIHSDTNLKQFEASVLPCHFQIQKCTAAHENIYWAFKTSLK